MAHERLGGDQAYFPRSVQAFYSGVFRNNGRYGGVRFGSRYCGRSGDLIGVFGGAAFQAAGCIRSGRYGQAGNG